MTLSWASALVMTTSQRPLLAPLSPLEVGERVVDRRLRIVAEGHQERLHAPGEQQLAEQHLVIGKRIDRDADRPQGGQRVGQKAAAREHHDARLAQLLRQHRRRAEHLRLRLDELEHLVESPLLRRLDGVDDVRHDLDALERIEADRRLAGEHHRVGALAHRGGDVGDLGAGRHRRADHRLQQLRGDDDRPAFGQAEVDDPRLHQRQRVVVDLDPQIAARHHHRVGGLDDALQVAQAALVFDLGDDAGLRAEPIEQLPEHGDVLALANEGERHEVDAGGHPGADVVLVLLRQRRKADLDPRQVDVPPRAELAGRQHAAAHVRRVQLDDHQPHEAAVEEDGGPHLHVRRQPGIVHEHAADAVGGGHGVQLEDVARLELDRFGQRPGPDLRPLDVHHHGDVPPELVRHLADALDQRRRPLAGPVGHVEAEDVDARGDELPEPLGAFGRRAQRGDDLGMSVVTAHVGDTGRHRLSRVVLRAGFATSWISVDPVASRSAPSLLHRIGLSETPGPSIVD